MTGPEQCAQRFGHDYDAEIDSHACGDAEPEHAVERYGVDFFSLDDRVPEAAGDQGGGARRQGACESYDAEIGW